MGHIYNCCAGGGGSGGGGGGGGHNQVSFEQFSRAVTSNGYPAPSREQYDNFISGSTAGRISSTQELAMALAIILHESDGLTAKRELACLRDNCGRKYSQEGCDFPGQYDFGRGYIQLTHCENYERASNALIGDKRLVGDPDIVARDESVAWRTTFWYWSWAVHDAPGVQSGQFGASTKAINGRLECSWPGHPAAQKRFEMYGRVRHAFGLQGGGDPSGCA